MFRAGPGFELGFEIGSPVGNEESSQRQAQWQAPFGRIVPVPVARGLPVEGITD